MTKVKICGLHRAEDIAYVNEAKPEYIGFVFAKSKRQISKGQARKLKSLLNPQIKAVGVFVNAPAEEMIELVEEGIIDIVQLHGQEESEVVETLKKSVGVPIIQAFSINSKQDLKRVKESIADYVLLDSSQAGSGQSFDWKLLNDCVEIAQPIFLAGGINNDNVEVAVRKFNPYAIDVSSGVEEDGYKSQRKIAEIVRRTRNV